MEVQETTGALSEGPAAYHREREDSCEELAEIGCVTYPVTISTASSQSHYGC